MSQSQDEARAARIQKYKEERRRQLTVRTAALFSANVTERRPKKTPGRELSEDAATQLKSSSELNISAVSSSVPIRTTRTSRLRAAAANHADSPPSSKKTNRSSSVQSLVDDVKTSKIIDRDKTKISRRYSHEKENFKSSPSPSVSDKEIGATKKKTKHSISKTVLDIDKCKNLVSCSKATKDVKGSPVTDEKNKINSIDVDDAELINVESTKIDLLTADKNEDLNELINETSLTIPNGLSTDDLKQPLTTAIEAFTKVNNIDLEYNKTSTTKLSNGDIYENCHVNCNIPVIDVAPKIKKIDTIVNLDSSVVPKREEGQGLLGVVCVRKVERFSELISNLCSPYETDLLFEDILAENGINGSGDSRSLGPECSVPCRRAQPSPRIASTPKRTTTAPVQDAPGTASKPRTRRSVESTHSKTENSLPSSKLSPKNASYLSIGNKSPTKILNSNIPIHKPNEKRRSSESGTKPSHIPKRTPEKQTRPSKSPIKQESLKDVNLKLDSKTKLESSKTKYIRKSPEKVKSDTDNNRIDRRHRAQKDIEKSSEKYHSKKRLISLENNSSRDTNDFKKTLSNNNPQNEKLQVIPAFHGSTDKNKDSKMSTLHEPLRPHAGTSRLSQEMDNLAELTKQTLDRVNKLSTNLTLNKLNTTETKVDSMFSSISEQKNINLFKRGLTNQKALPSRGVTERLKDIDTAAQRLIDFGKQSAMYSDLNNDTSSQNRRIETTSAACSHTPVSILKRKSNTDECAISNVANQAISSPPVTFSPSVIEPRQCQADNRQKQGILKKRRSLDESQVARRRSCSPEVSFADDGSADTKPILKNRRSSLEDIIRNRSPDGQIHGILKRKMSREEEQTNDDLSHGSPEPHGILKRKSNSSSSSSTTSSHVSIAQAVLLAAAGGAEIVEEDKESVRPILKKKSFSEERTCPDNILSETPKPILKKKSIESDDYDFELPKRPILKTSKKLSGDEGHASSFDLSEDDRSSRRPSLLRSRTSDHSGSECETTVKPILKQRGSSLSRERSQSPRPRLSFCSDNDASGSVTNFSSEASDLPSAGPWRVLNLASDQEENVGSLYTSAVVRRRNLRPKSNIRSKSLACEVNNELLSILNNRRLQVDVNCENRQTYRSDPEECENNNEQKSFPSIAARIKSMEQALQPSQLLTSRSKNRDKDRYKTQPITIDEMRSAASSLEPSQASFQAFSIVGCSFPSRPVETGAAGVLSEEPERDPFVDLIGPLDSPPFEGNSFAVTSTALLNGHADADPPKDDSYGEATFLDFENICDASGRKQSTLDDIESEVNKVRLALDEDSRALDEDYRHQAEADNWSLNVSCDSGVYNRASSRDSGPHSGEELGLVESQQIKENHATNSSSSNEWSSTSIERGLLTMERERKSTETEMLRDQEELEESEDEGNDGSGFALGLVKSNSVIARASMWQQLQQQAKGVPKPLLRHSRAKAKESTVAERFKTQPISFSPPEPEVPKMPVSLAQSKSTANVLDRDEDAKLDEDDPAKMSIMDKMRMFNSKLTHKPPMAGVPRPREERAPRSSRLRTMPVLASQVQEAMEQNERLTKSLTHEEPPRNNDFQLKMELFRSASAKNTSLEYIMRQDSKFKSLEIDDDESPPDLAQRMITPEVRGILKSGSTVVPAKPKILAKGESSEGLKDEGIDSSSDDDSASETSVSSSEKSCSSSDSSDEIPGPKPRRFQRKNNKLKSSRTDSDLAKVFQDQRKVQMPCAKELKERLTQVKNAETKAPILAKLGKKPTIEKTEELNNNVNVNNGYKKVIEPIQLGKLRRPVEKMPTSEKPPTVLKISALNKEAKNKFFGLDTREKSIDELTAAVRKYIPPVSKSISTHALELASGSDGESSGGREVRHINTRHRNRGGGGLQKSATNADMPNRGSTIAERLAALQAAGANDWRARVCRISPEREDPKAIERAKNKINESLNAAVEDKKKVHIEDNELSANILADRRTKLETAAQGWRKRVPATDASLFTVAGRLERDKERVPAPLTPPPAQHTPPAPQTPSSPGIPVPNKFRSRKQNSPPNGFSPGPLRSASCAVVCAAAVETQAKQAPRPDRDAFKRSHSVSESISRLDEKEESPGAEKSGCTVPVPRADDETFQAFFTPVIEGQERMPDADLDLDLDLDAIDSGSRHLLQAPGLRRARRTRRHAARGNPLRALAARTDLRQAYSPPPQSHLAEQLIKERAVANCGLAAEALAALASKEDFSSVALKSAATPTNSHGTKPIMLMHVKGRRRVQTRLIEPVHTNVNRGDSFVLVTPDQVFLYIGLYANVIERNRSTDIAAHIHNTKDLGCKNSTAVIKIDEQTKNYSNKHWNQFWTLLGVKDNVENYTPFEAGHPDEDEIYESSVIQTNMSYEVSDDELVPIKEYWGQAPKIAMLNQTKTIVFDYGSEMYIWYGKNVPLESRRRSAQLAQELFDEGYNYEECHINPLNAATHQGSRNDAESPSKSAKTRPEWAIFSKVTQHMETILFKEKFLDWPDYTRVIKVKPQENKTSSAEITPCDAEEMWSNEYQDPDLILEGSHIGRGTTYYDKETMRHYDIRTKSVCKWVIQEYDYQKVENESEIGEFFSGDSYIIRWEYQITVSGRELNGKPSKHNMTGRDRCAYFCWQGRDASSNEKGAAALLTVELDREKGPQVRVAQGNEPPAFLNLFQGNLVVHQGKRDVDKNRYRLFVTRGNLSNEAYLLQVPCSVRQLRSRGSLLLVDTEKGYLYIWHGARSLKHTKNIAIELANKLIARKSKYLFGLNVADVKITEVKEGEEPKSVLEALGGANKQYYNSVLSASRESSVDITPRLFHFTDLGGSFEASEILSPLRHEHLVTPFPFEQKELYSASQPALFLLDDGTNVWLWQGWWEHAELEVAETNNGVGAFAGRWQALRAAALHSAEAYYRVSRPQHAQAEPSEAEHGAKLVLAGLEPQAFTSLFDTWADRDDAADANIAHGWKAGSAVWCAAELSRLTSRSQLLPLAVLQRRPLPDDVDAQRLERHLSAHDFLEAFGMTKEEFLALPAWKQTYMKKDVGLF